MTASTELKKSGDHASRTPMVFPRNTQDKKLSKRCSDSVSSHIFCYVKNSGTITNFCSRNASALFSALNNHYQTLGNSSKTRLWSFTNSNLAAWHTQLSPSTLSNVKQCFIFISRLFHCLVDNYILKVCPRNRKLDSNLFSPLNVLNWLSGSKMRPTMFFAPSKSCLK